MSVLFLNHHIYGNLSMAALNTLILSIFYNNCLEELMISGENEKPVHRAPILLGFSFPSVMNILPQCAFVTADEPALVCHSQLRDGWLCLP